MKNRFKAIFTIIVLQLFFSLQVYSQSSNEYALKSAFLIRLTNFIEWPENSKVANKNEDFIIGVIGKNPFGNGLENVIKAKNLKIKQKNILVKPIKKISEIKTTDLLFVCSSEKNNLSNILKEADKYPILTIGDTKEYTSKGVMINLFISKNYLTFDVNLKSAKKNKFYVSSKLLANAKNVIK